MIKFYKTITPHSEQVADPEDIVSVRDVETKKTLGFVVFSEFAIANNLVTVEGDRRGVPCGCYLVIDKRGGCKSFPDRELAKQYCERRWA